MRKRVKVITVERSHVRELMQLHGASQTGVYNALAYRSNSDMAQRIRKDALEKFGGLVQNKIIFAKN